MNMEPNAEVKAAMRADQKMFQKDRKAMEYILSDQNGRWFLMRLFERCHIMGSTFPPDDHTNRMLINEGERRVGLNLLDRIVGDLEALEAKALAEKEYYQFMNEMRQNIEAAKEKEI